MTIAEVIAASQRARGLQTHRGDSVGWKSHCKYQARPDRETAHEIAFIPGVVLIA
jgi:hypothetical protein